MLNNIDDDIFPVVTAIVSGVIVFVSLGIGAIDKDNLDLAKTGMTAGATFAAVAGTAHQANRKTTTRRSNNSTK